MSSMSAHTLVLLEQVWRVLHASRCRITSALLVVAHVLFATRLCLHFISFSYLSHGLPAKRESLLIMQITQTIVQFTLHTVMRECVAVILELCRCHACKSLAP